MILEKSRALCLSLSGSKSAFSRSRNDSFLLMCHDFFVVFSVSIEYLTMPIILVFFILCYFDNTLNGKIIRSVRLFLKGFMQD